MKSYLHFFSGPHQFLVCTDQVLSIEDGADDFHGGLIQERSWRGRRLPVINLNRLLKTEAQPRQQLVIGADTADAAACVLEVDQIDRLLELTDDDFTGLASISPELDLLVDAVHVPQDNQQCFLRLKLPFSLQLVHRMTSALDEEGCSDE